MIKESVRMTDKSREGQGSTSKSSHGHMKDWEMKLRQDIFEQIERIKETD